MKSLLAFTLPLLLLFTVAAAAEDKCPISGKAAKDDVFLEVNGKKVHFCCDKCPAEYKKKINLVADEGEKKCPLDGKSVAKDESVIESTAEVVAFCCDKCPKTYKKNLGITDDKGSGKCPISGKESKPETAQIFIKSKTVAFCCGDCKKTYADKHFKDGHVIGSEAGGK